MKILLRYRQDYHKDKWVPSYCDYMRRALLNLGHDVYPVGEGHNWQLPGSPHPIIHDQLNPDYFDLLLELDNGRNQKGELGFGEYSEIKIPKAVWFIDSHGQPDLHQTIARKYAHVFFAVYSRRDLFAKHPSAFWCPNATEPVAFPKALCEPACDFGFFGSKGGLARADALKAIAERRGWSTDIRQINGPFKPKWPYTAEAMGNCAALFNHGQKHDGPNLRVLESMAVGRPLITDVDDQSGMGQLFTAGEHYLGYTAYSHDGLEEAMAECIKRPADAATMAQKAYELVMSRHLVKNRAEQIMEVVGGK